MENLKADPQKNCYMSYNVETVPNFEKEAKKLAKKYKSLASDLQLLFNQLELDPFLGQSLGNHIYKIRLAVKSKGKGKSGGARVLTMVKIVSETVYLFSIYDKSEKENVTDAEIQQLIKSIPGYSET